MQVVAEFSIHGARDKSVYGEPKRSRTGNCIDPRARSPHAVVLGHFLTAKKIFAFVSSVGKSTQMSRFH